MCMHNHPRRCDSHHHGLESDELSKFPKLYTRPDGGMLCICSRAQFGAGMFSRHHKCKNGIRPMVARICNHEQKPIKRKHEHKFGIPIWEETLHFGWRIFVTFSKLQCTNCMPQVLTSAKYISSTKRSRVGTALSPNGYGAKHGQNPMQHVRLQNLN